MSKALVLVTSKMIKERAKVPVPGNGKVDKDMALFYEDKKEKEKEEK